MEVSDNFVRKAMRGVAAVGVRSVRASTPVGPTGNLKRSIGYKEVRATKKAPVKVGLIGARMGRGFKGYHANLIAGGHKASGKFKHGPDVKGIGNWIQKAAQEKVPKMESQMTKKYQVFLTRSINQYANKVRFKR
jgi:hypothetical protein